jgi:hypothetical protein
MPSIVRDGAYDLMSGFTGHKLLPSPKRCRLSWVHSGLYLIS